MNQDLHTLYAEDRNDHQHGLMPGTREYDAMRARDRERRKRADDILASGAHLEAEDLYHAAWLFNHGETVDDARKARDLSRRSAALGHPPAKWLSAAAYDRWLMYQGRPQKYGTQIVPDGRRYRVWDIEPGISDADRVELDVPPLKEQKRRAAELSRLQPLPPMQDAPDWLRDAVERWRSEDGVHEDDDGSNPPTG